MALIELTNVTKAFPPQKRGGSALVAVDDVSIGINAGEIFGIIGHSGAGKSTLVRLINGLEPVTGGEVIVDGFSITHSPESAVRKARTGIGMIFQQFNLLTSRSVAGNVAYPLEVAGVPKAERDARVAEMLDFVGLGERAKAFPEQLSGGQKQRVGIARALAAKPSILLADESTSALDPETTADVLALLQRVNREFGITIVVITHEMDVIARVADRVAVMAKGRVVELGNTYDVFTNPQSETAQRFVRTVVPPLPTGDDLRRLHGKHPGRLVSFSFRDDGADQSTIFRALGAAGLDIDLVHGGVHDLQGRTFGLLTLALRGADSVIDQAIASVDPRVTVTEVR